MAYLLHAAKNLSIVSQRMREVKKKPRISGILKLIWRDDPRPRTEQPLELPTCQTFSTDELTDELCEHRSVSYDCPSRMRETGFEDMIDPVSIIIINDDLDATVAGIRREMPWAFCIRMQLQQCFRLSHRPLDVSLRALRTEVVQTDQDAPAIPPKPIAIDSQNESGG